MAQRNKDINQNEELLAAFAWQGEERLHMCMFTREDCNKLCIILILYCEKIRCIDLSFKAVSSVISLIRINIFAFDFKNLHTSNLVM